MSTKIYTGCRVDPTEDAARLLNRQMTPAIHDSAIDAVAEYARYLHDHHDDLDDRDVPQQYARLSIGSAASVIIGGTSDDELINLLYREQTRFEVVFLSDPADGRRYAVSFGNSELINHWESLDWVEPWPYWNDTDPEEGCSRSDWDQRRAVWDRVLGDDPPADVGLLWKPSRYRVWGGITSAVIAERLRHKTGEDWSQRLRRTVRSVSGTGS